MIIQQVKSTVYKIFGDVAELVDALDLGSSVERCESSSLSIPTKYCCLIISGNICESSDIPAGVLLTRMRIRTL